ncbi:hypothetical protein E5288_WYG022638 [Bos mutus]|uniref:Uncharacterized protein n=1 Tax=Bos mutus TaxID=72004 RepID=A0A6B0QYA8_9CETA|nr:hypothetical protein [Bos mutus]
MKALLQLLMEAAYRVSKKKAQIFKEEVTGDGISRQMELVKVAGIAPRSHHTRVKKAYHADPENTEWTAQRDPADPRETKIILKKKEKKIPDEPLQDEAT